MSLDMRKIAAGAVGLSGLMGVRPKLEMLLEDYDDAVFLFAVEGDLHETLE